MKKSLLFLGIAFLLAHTNLLGQAIFTGAVNENWNIPGNWEWTDGGSGLPTITTDVVLEATAHIGPGESAVAKSITIDSDAYYEIILIADANLFVSGDLTYISVVNNISSSSYFPSFEGRLTFNGDADQVLTGSNLGLGTIVIDKPSGDIGLESSWIGFLDSLIFKSAPQPEGTASVGNIIVGTGSSVIMNAQGGIGLPEFTGAEIPPHIVISGPGDFETGSNIVLAYEFNLTTFEPGGINGKVLFPVGISRSSYTPITIEQEGSASNAFTVTLLDSTEYSCEADIDPAQSLNYVYRVNSFQFIGGELIPVTGTVAIPATVSFSFNAQNYGEEVSEGFDEMLARRLYLATEEDCTSLLELAPITSDYATYTAHPISVFGDFYIAYQGSSSIPELENELSATIYPNPAEDVLFVNLPVAKSPVLVEVYDLQGRAHLAKTFEPSSFMPTASVDIQMLPAGTYVLQLSAKEGRSVSKFTIQR